MILAPLLKLPKNVGDLGKFIVAKSFKSCPKCKKLPTLVTLPMPKMFQLKFTLGQSEFRPCLETVYNLNVVGWDGR